MKNKISDCFQFTFSINNFSFVCTVNSNNPVDTDTSSTTTVSSDSRTLIAHRTIDRQYDLEGDSARLFNEWANNIYTSPTTNNTTNDELFNRWAFISLRDQYLSKWVLAFYFTVTNYQSGYSESAFLRDSNNVIHLQTLIEVLEQTGNSIEVDQLMLGETGRLSISSFQ